MSIQGDGPAIIGPQYARFSRRLRGIMLDSILGLVATAIVLLIAASSANDLVSRVTGFVFVAALLLYEPLLVSFTGGTVGHHLTNLRVVDDRGGNVSFPKAFARMVIKGVLGWYSFVILMATRRNQAVHDLVTRSTVQIRDPAKALPGQYVVERREPVAANMPPSWQRIIVILAYLPPLYVVGFGLLVAFTSRDCLRSDHYCSGAEEVANTVTAIGLLFLTASIIGLGWRGRLFGARKR